MKVALLGDMAFYGKYSMKNENVYDYFSDVAKFLSDFDLVVGNLETPLCSRKLKAKGPKSAHIRADEENVELLKYLNISAVSLANNHLYDYGKKGYASTKKILSENDIDFFGVDGESYFFRAGNNNLALSGYCCYSTNPLGLRKFGGRGVNVFDPQEIEKELVENHKNGFLNIAQMHVGQEHVHYPNYDHVEIARKLAAKIPYVYCGHHPHVIQGIEKIDQSLIAYSLGNFCFDDVYTPKSNAPLIKQSDANRTGIILVLEVNDSILVNYETIPLYMGDETMHLAEDYCGIGDKIHAYSEYLKKDKRTFIKERSEMLETYVSSRRNRRNLNWYIQRLNFNSFGILYNGRKNANKYKELLSLYHRG